MTNEMVKKLLGVDSSGGDLEWQPRLMAWQWAVQYKIDGLSTHGRPTAGPVLFCSR